MLGQCEILRRIHENNYTIVVCSALAVEGIAPFESKSKDCLSGVSLLRCRLLGAHWWASGEENTLQVYCSLFQSSLPIGFDALGKLTIFNMANLQRIVISLLLIVTVGFLFLAQTSSATKGPKITNKVRIPDLYSAREH